MTAPETIDCDRCRKTMIIVGEKLVDGVVDRFFYLCPDSLNQVTIDATTNERGGQFTPQTIRALFKLGTLSEVGTPGTKFAWHLQPVDKPPSSES